MFPKEGIGLKRGLVICVLLISLTFGTAATAGNQDSWMWRLETERLTREALAVQAEIQGQLYQVKRGDTLWGLANGLGVDLGVLMAMNYLAPGDLIYAGQTIRLPVEPDKVYQVRYQDTLWAIAQQFEVDLKLLMTANKITKPESLQVGTILTIPGNPLALQVDSRSINNTAAASRLKELILGWPVEGRITSSYGQRGSEFHHGLDIGAQAGTDIKAALGGIVIFAGYKNQIYGNVVEIRHDPGLTTMYAHNSKTLVKVGEKVAKGQKIALVGSTGRATGPHVHFELRVNGQTFNPIHYLKK